jgi:hypothetical protein
MVRLPLFAQRHSLLVGVAGLAACFGLACYLTAQQPSPFPAGPIVPSGTVVAHDATPGQTALPINFPDKFAWKLFLEVNKKAEKQLPINDKPNAPLSNDAYWETWADDPQTFPAEPDPANPPKWPDRGQVKAIKAMGPPLRFRLERLRKGMTLPQIVAVGKLTPGGFSAPDGKGVGEEVHRNRVTFDYIVNNGLWYREGIAAFFANAAKAVGNDVDFTARTITLPRNSIEIKANWIVIDEKDKPRFHWNYNTDGQLLGLVAMHVISKDLPNWFWCTFEHVDNPGRGDFIGIHDSFGSTQPHVPSFTDQAGKPYPAGQMTSALEAMFKECGYEGDWAEQYKNYRLKGSQVDFTDGAGRNLVLGNSVTEGGFVPTASCITCHARATVNATGASGLPIFGEQSTLPLIVTDSLQPILTYNGRPDPSWYFSDPGTGSTLQNLQADFLWAIPFRAQPKKAASRP